MTVISASHDQSTRHERPTAHLMSASEDIRSDEQLRVSEAKFSGILAIAADAIITIDDAHRIMHFNRGAEEIFGYTAAQAIGQPISILLPERYRLTHDAQIQAFGRSGESARRMGHRRAVAGLRSNGSEFPAEASISKLDLPTGERIYTVLLRDITERKWAEDADRFLSDSGTRLAQSLQYEAALDTIGELCIPMLGDGCFIDVVEDNAIRRVARATDPEKRRIMNRLADHFMPTWDSPSPVIDVLRRGRPELVEHVDADWLSGHEEHPDAIALWQELDVRSLFIVPRSEERRVRKECRV